jgi:hypothetical protein
VWATRRYRSRVGDNAITEPGGENGTTSSAARPRLRSAAVRLGLVPDPPGPAVYHGFISYSHAADGKLAPALQKGLQQFAKPWYRVRALHIFRDDAALSANPQLWGSVRKALDSSQYLILLASPRAAQSDWVTREVEHWRDHKRPDRILIGLTDGELRFGRTQRASLPAERNALPEPLAEMLDEEPRYIDLRWARNSEDLVISHPRFRDAVAELAAPLHGKPKDELASEEVRQHRRTVRLARGATAAILTLFAAAVVAAVIALVQRANAVTEARVASARQIAAVAQTQMANNLDVALPLAAQAYRIDANPQTRGALFQANLASQHLLQYVPMGSTVAHLAGSGNGSALVAGLADGQVKRWSFGMASPAVVLKLPAAVSSVAISENGDEIAAADGSKAVLWRARQSPTPLRGPPGEDAVAVALSPSGSTLAVYYRVHQRVFQGAQSIAIFDAARGLTPSNHALPTSGWAPSALVVPDDSRLLLFDESYGNWEWRRLADWARLDGGSAGFGVHQSVPGYANDGSSFTVSNGSSTIPVWPTKGPTDAQNAPLSAGAPISAPTALTLSPGGVQAAVADSGTIYVARVHPSVAASGSPVTLVGNGSINTDGLRFLGDGSHLLSASNDAVAVWNLSQIDRLSHTYRSPLVAEPCNGCGGATVVVSPNGRHVAALDDKGSIVVQAVGAGGGPPHVLRQL